MGGSRRACTQHNMDVWIFYSMHEGGREGKRVRRGERRGGEERECRKEEGEGEREK